MVLVFFCIGSEIMKNSLHPYNSEAEPRREAALFIPRFFFVGIEFGGWLAHHPS